MSLLDKAKKIQTKSSNKVFHPDELELLIAYVEGKITLTQIKKVTNAKNSNVYPWIVTRLHAAYANGLLKTEQGHS